LDIARFFTRFQDSIVVSEKFIMDMNFVSKISCHYTINNNYLIWYKISHFLICILITCILLLNVRNYCYQIIFSLKEIIFYKNTLFSLNIYFIFLILCNISSVNFIVELKSDRIFTAITLFLLDISFKLFFWFSINKKVINKF
jgi:hypothetical protein